MRNFIIGLIVCLLFLGVVYTLNINSPKGTNWYVFDENQDVWTGRVIFLPEEIEIKNCCRLWPVNEPLELGGYWAYSTDLDQWIVCD